MSALLAVVLMGTGYSFAYQGSNVDSITFVEHTDESTVLAKIQNGDFDIYYYPVPYSVTGDSPPSGVQVFDSAGGTRYDLFVNPADATAQFNPFAYRDVRYSLNFLVDRDAIVRDMFQGHGQPMFSSFGPTHPDYILVYRQLEAAGIRYDPQLADSMISGAMAANGATKADGKWYAGDSPVAVTIFVRNDDPVRESIGRSLEKELSALGFEVSIKTGNLLEAYNTVFGSDPADLKWHVYTGGFSGSSVTKYDNSNLAAFYAPWALNMPGQNNPEYWSYENPQLDEITRNIYDGSFANVSERANLVRQATALATQDAVRIFLGTEDNRYVARDGITGLVNAQGHGITNRATPINADSPDGSLTIGVKYISQSAWNPVQGLADTYSNNIWNILNDPAAVRDPFTGDLTPVRSTWSVDTAGPDGTMDVPDEAVMWNPASQGWDAVRPDAQATSKVTLDFTFSSWHTGLPMTMNDVLYPLYLVTEWSTDDSDNPDDKRKYSDQIISAGKEVKGIRVTSPTSVEVYVDYWHFDDTEIASEAIVWSSIPWEIYAAMEQVVLDGDAAFSNANAVANGVPWISLLDRGDSGLVKAALDGFAADGTVPAGLHGNPTSPGARYAASSGWIDAKGNAVISNGPFYLDGYDPDAKTLVANAFDDSSYPLKPGHWKYLAEDRVALDGTVTIGAIAPVTGGASGYGVEIREASDLAVSDFNEYLGRINASWTLEADRRDSATDPSTALRELTALNDAGIKIIDGPALDYTQDVLDFGDSNGMLLMSCCSVTTEFAKPGDSMFRLTAGHPHDAARLAGLIDGAGITAMVPAGRDIGWVNNLLDLTGTAFASLDGANVVADRVSYTTDMAAGAAGLAAAVQAQVDAYGADRVAVAFIGFEENVEFVKAASAHGVLDDVRWFGAELNTVEPNVTGDPATREFASKVGLTSIQPTVRDNQITAYINKHFAGLDGFRSPPSVYANIEYDAVWLLGLSMLKAQSTDVEAVKGALAEVSRTYVGASGNTELNAAGDRAGGIYATWKVVGGEWVEVVDIGGLVPVTRADGAGVHRQVAKEIAISDFNDYLAEKGAKWRIGLDIKDTIADGYSGPIKELNDDGIIYVSGPSASSGIGKIRDYVNFNNMLLLSCCSTAPSMAIAGDNVFRLAADDSLQAPVLASIMTDNGAEVLVTVWRDDLYGNGLRDSTTAEFVRLGGTADDLGSYPTCDTDGCYDATFTEMARQLADKVQGHVDTYGADKVAVLYVGLGESQSFFGKAADHPVLSTVQWMGADSNVLNGSLVSDPKVFAFLRDANFRASIFDKDATGETYKKLHERLLADPRIVGTPNVYAYSSYDSVWVLGLAMDAAGDGGFEEVKRQIPPIAADYSGALGNIRLNAAGDLAAASYAVWGVESGGWEQVGTYVPGVGLVRPDAVIGGLLNLQGSWSGENVRQRVMEIAVNDFNAQNVQTPLVLSVADISSQRTHTAMQNIRHDMDDDGNRDRLRQAIDAAIAAYDASVAADPANGADAYFDTISGTGQGSPSSPFVIDGATGIMVAHDDGGARGANIEAFRATYSKDLGEINGDAAGGETWWQHMVSQAGAYQLKRSLLVAYDGYIFGSGYYPERNGVSYFIGPSSSSSLAMAKAYADVYATDAVMVSPSSTAPSLAVADSVFRLVPPDTYQVPAIISKLDGDGKTMVVAVYRDGPWGNGIAGTLKDSYGGTIASIPYQIASPDHSGVAAELERQLAAAVRSAGATATAVVFIGFDNEFIDLVKTINSNPAAGAFGVKWYGTDGIATSGIIAADPAAGPIAAMVGISATIFEVPDNEVNSGLSAQLLGEGLDVVPYSFGYYDAVHLLGNSIIEAERRGTTVAGAIPGVAERSSGALGDYSLDGAGDLDRPLSYAVYRVVSQPGPAPQWANESGFGAIAGTVSVVADGHLPLASAVQIKGSDMADAAKPDFTFGTSTEGVGDLDGDGTTDVAVGAPGSPTCECTGAVHVLFLNPDGTVKRTATVDGTVPNGPSLADGDQFGTSAAGVGDLDGDGTPDIAVGAPGHLLMGAATGDLYVIFMNPDGTVKRTAEVNGTVPNGPSLSAGDRFGASAAGVGDLDGDGTPDIAVGAPGNIFGSAATGDLYVIFMNPDGTVKRTAEVNGTVPNGPSLSAGDRFGASAAGVGDLDGDGTPDIAVGAPGHTVGNAATGDLYVIFMNPDGTVKRTAEVNGTVPNGPSLSAGDRFGASAAGVGDLDGDGTPDIAVGAPGPVPCDCTGAVHVLFLNPDGTVKLTATVDGQTPNVPSLSAGDRFGASAAGVGDLDGDGTVDIAVGTFGNDTMYVIFMNPDGTVKRTAEIAGGDIAPPSYVNHFFGQSIAGIGDLDGDGVADAAVGAPGHSRDNVFTGEAYIMFMNADGTVKRVTVIDGTTPSGPVLGPADRFGASAAGVGDLDGDGTPDIAVGAPGHLLRGTTTGDLYVIFMNPDGTVKRTAGVDGQTPNGPPLSAGDRFGASVAGVGDLDGDGTPDIAVGAPGSILGSAATGDLYVIFMNPDGTVKRTAEVNGTVPNGPSLAGGDVFGQSVSGLGDLDGDGTPDIAVGAPGRVLGSAVSGDAFVLLMNPDGTVKLTAGVDGQTPNGPPLSAGDRFGSSVAGVGDLDGDGTPDIAVGAPGPVTCDCTGAVHVLFLNPDGTVKRTATVDGQTPNGPPLSAGDSFGTSVASIGDLDGDGDADLAAGAFTSPSVYVMYTATVVAGGTYGIGNVGITAIDYSNMQSVGTVTAADGTYRFDNAGLGPYLVQVSPFPTGYTVADGTVHYSQVTLAPGGTSAADFGLVAIPQQDYATLSGTVFADADGDGAMDAGEPGIAGHAMIATDLLTGTVTMATTGQDGTYSFSGITPDPGVTLVQSSYFPSGHTLTTGQAYTYVQAPDSGSSLTFDVGFRPAQQSELVTLVVVAYVDANFNGILDAGEAAVPGVSATTYQYATGESGTVTTGSDGAAGTAYLVPSSWVAQAAVPDGYAVTSPADPVTGVIGALTVADPAPGSTYVMNVGLAPVP